MKTHKMTDLSGITVTPGVLPAQLKESLNRAVERIGGKLADTVRIDTTHFVTVEGRGIAWEKAVEMNIPVVRPEWVEGCEAAGKIVGVRQYYLDADPRQRQVVHTQPQHQEPEAPKPAPQPQQQNNPSPNGGDAATPPPPPAKDEPKEEEESSDEGGDESREDGSEKQAMPAEQKVRAEDPDLLKVTLRPSEPALEPAQENGGDSESEDEKEIDRVKAEKEAAGTSTPGNASFQDVAL